MRTIPAGNHPEEIFLIFPSFILFFSEIVLYYQGESRDRGTQNFSGELYYFTPVQYPETRENNYQN